MSWLLTTLEEGGGDRREEEELLLRTTEPDEDRRAPAAGVAVLKNAHHHRKKNTTTITTTTQRISGITHDARKRKLLLLLTSSSQQRFLSSSSSSFGRFVGYLVVACPPPHLCCCCSAHQEVLLSVVGGGHAGRKLLESQSCCAPRRPRPASAAYAVKTDMPRPAPPARCLDRTQTYIKGDDIHHRISLTSKLLRLCGGDPLALRLVLSVMRLLTIDAAIAHLAGATAEERNSVSRRAAAVARGHYHGRRKVRRGRSQRLGEIHSPCETPGNHVPICSRRTSAAWRRQHPWPSSRSAHTLQPSRSPCPSQPPPIP